MSGFGGGYDTGGGAGYGSYGGGGGGGGYMDNGGGGGGGGYGYGGGGRGGGGGDVRSRSDSLQPVTVKQLHDAVHDAPDDKYMVNGNTLGLVTFVGRIMSCKVQVTMITLTMDDCTGKLNAVYMLDADDNEYAQQKREHIKDLAWVRMIGNMRQVDGVPQLDALSIKGVPDMNELTFHRLEVVRAFLSQTKARPTVSGTTPVRHGMSKVGISSGIGGPVPYGGGGGTAGGITGAMAVDTFDNGMTPQMTAVYNYLKQRHEVADSQDVHVSEVTRNVPGVGDEKSVRSIMDSLASDGHVYSTIDEDHFAFCMA